MNARQRRFAEEYLVDLNAARAAERAGYSRSTARKQSSRLLQNPEVAGLIKRAMEERSRRTGIEADWVLQTLKSVAQRCLAQEKVTNRKGEATGEYRFDARGATKALELMGRHLGMFGGGKGVKGPKAWNGMKDPKEMSDEELSREIAKIDPGA